MNILGSNPCSLGASRDHERDLHARQALLRFRTIATSSPTSSSSGPLSAYPGASPDLAIISLARALQSAREATSLLAARSSVASQALAHLPPVLHPPSSPCHSRVDAEQLQYLNSRLSAFLTHAKSETVRIEFSSI